MVGKKNISQYRQRLDKTLASYDLANEENLKVLVKNQILRSSQSETEEYFENVVEKRTKEVSNFLKMLKSASMNDDGSSNTRESPRKSWKIKQDTEEYRVMYREGPEGTPFHTLLVEGYIDGPLDVCLCISWESFLYGKWWPQSTIPTFKIVSSECLQKVRIGEQISLVRMKVSWPLSAREALVHFFEFEYFKDGLIIVLLNSISDLENVDVSTHGFSRDGIPDAQEVVRIDVVGGFALQKVTADRSYFRTIATMDIKLDFVPPSFINFISRQLIGSGFKLYQKEVASVTRGDEDFGKALKDPLYARVREALYSDNKEKVALEPESAKNETCTGPEEALYSDNKEKVALEPEDAKNETCTAPEGLAKLLQAEEGNMDKKVIGDDHATETLPENAVIVGHKAPTEIEEIVEEDMPESRQLVEDDSEEIQNPTTSQIEEKCYINNHKKVAISPQVKQALETLERVIYLIRENKFDPQSRSLPGSIHAECSDLRESGVKDSKSSEDVQICSNGGVCADATKSEAAERASHEPRNSCASHYSRNTRSSSYSRETNHNRIAPASPDENIPYPSETRQTALGCTNDERTEDSIEAKTTFHTILITGDKNVYSPEKKHKYRRWRRFCCLHSNSG